MIYVDSEKTTKSLEDAKQEIIRKLKNMVVNMTTDLVEIASDNTPVGDAEALEERPSYRFYYEQREDVYGIEVDVGFHAGAWIVSSVPTGDFDPTIYAPEQTVTEAKTNASSLYNIGESLFVLGVGPAYEKLENGFSAKSPMGISKPTFDQITKVFKINAQSYYR